MAHFTLRLLTAKLFKILTRTLRAPGFQPAVGVVTRTFLCDIESNYLYDDKTQVSIFRTSSQIFKNPPKTGAACE
jgi:hypothetical protein